MSLTLETVLAACHSRGGWESLEDNEAEGLFNVAMTLMQGERILEIGCELGRSSVLFALVAKERKLDYHCCDIWVSGSSYAAEWIQGVITIGAPFHLHYHDSGTLTLPGAISLLYVDGDHTESGITSDLEQHLDNVHPGGYVCFHDYGRASLPDVEYVADMFMDEEWTHIGTYRTLAIWRRK